MTNVLYMLLGATFVALGVLAAAAADRIRGLRVSREPLARVPRAQATIPVVESAEVRAAPAPAKPRSPRAEAKPQANTDGGDDVIAALVAAGYKRVIAAEATWACGAGERASIEGWTAAALRRCARGGLS